MRSIWLVLMLLALSIGISPAPAQAEAVDLPPLASLKTVRDRYVMSFNGQPLRVCQTEWASWSRAHGACHDLVTLELPGDRLVAGHQVEFVYYDGVRYERADAETTWTAAPDPDFDPDRTLNDALFRVTYAAVLTDIGMADVDGVAATQYQYWSYDKRLNAQSGGQAVFDLFITPDNRVVKSQFSARGTIAGLGEGELADIWVFTDHNGSIAVAPPPPDQVRQL
jgi:hypothetical protein